MTGTNVAAYLRLLAEDGGGAHGAAVELDLPPVGDRPGNRLGLTESGGCDLPAALLRVGRAGW